MARILIPSNTPVGLSLLIAVNQIIATQARLSRLAAVVAEITNNGAARGNLETSAEALFPVGTGAGLYAGIQSLKGSLDSLAGLVATIDQGYSNTSRE